jgi:hypothetical protein
MDGLQGFPGGPDKSEIIRHLIDLGARTCLEISEDRALAWGNLQIFSQNLDMIIPGAKVSMTDDDITVSLPPEYMT